MKTLAVLLAAGFVAACATLGDAPAPPLQRMPVAGGTLAYAQQGSGVPVVLVHGAAGDWRTWEPLRPYIAARYRFVSYSRRFHHPNAPEGEGQPYTVPQHAADLIAFVRGLGAGPVHAVGGSMGARILAEAALKEPHWFRSIVLSEPLMTRPVAPADLAAAAPLADEAGRFLAMGRSGNARLATLQLLDFVFGEPEAAQRLPARRLAAFLDNETTMVAWARGGSTPLPTCEQLASIRVPVLVMEGEQTRPAFRATNNRLMECLPRGTARFAVPAAPHAWYPVNPADGSRAILEFLRPLH